MSSHTRPGADCGSVKDMAGWGYWRKPPQLQSYRNAMHFNCIRTSFCPLEGNRHWQTFLLERKILILTKLGGNLLKF